MVKGLIVQATGLESESPTVKAMLSSFKALKAFADFEAEPVEAVPDEPLSAGSASAGSTSTSPQLRLGYNINLNLPNTTDVAVFNAIFKSLREHLLS